MTVDELGLIRSVTTRLPRVRGAGRLANALISWHMRRRRPPTRADVLGFSMRLDPSEFIDRVFLFYPRFWDPLERAFLARTLKHGDTFVDVGAHIGMYSLLASRLVGPGGAVLAIEADPFVFERLRTHLAWNVATNVRAVNVAAAATSAMARLSVNHAGNRGASSLLATGGPCAAIDVEGQSLADILTGNDIAEVAGLKLDIEGLEYRVLSAFFANAPPRLWPRFILTEFWPDLMPRAGGNVLNLLETYRYGLHLVAPPNYIFIHEGVVDS